MSNHRSDCCCMTCDDSRTSVIEAIKRAARKAARAELIEKANITAEKLAKGAIDQTDSTQGKYYHNEIIDLEELARISAALDLADEVEK